METSSAETLFAPRLWAPSVTRFLHGSLSGEICECVGERGSVSRDSQGLKTRKSVKICLTRVSKRSDEVLMKSGRGIEKRGAQCSFISLNRPV